MPQSNPYNRLYWKSQRVLVVGGAGFLGRQIVALLEKAEAGRIVVPRKADYDLTRQDAAEDLFSQDRYDMVINAAGYVGGIGANRAEPGAMFYRNLMLGVNVLEQARLKRIPRHVYVGSVCSYPEFAAVPFRESDLWAGRPEPTNGAYGAAKKAILDMAQAYARQYNVSTAYLLCANLYGPGDDFSDRGHVIPALVRRFSEAKAGRAPSVTLWGTGEATREFLYVEDAARAVILAAEKYASIEPVNIGTGQSVSIKDLARSIAYTVGYDGRIEWDPEKPDGQRERQLEVGRAEREFGFRAEWPLSRGLLRTIDWYRGQYPSLLSR